MAKKKQQAEKPKLECYFDPKNASEGPCSEKPLDEKEDYCHGCHQIICEAHSRNLTVMGEHDPSEHLETEDETADE